MNGKQRGKSTDINHSLMLGTKKEFALSGEWVLNKVPTLGEA